MLSEARRLEVADDGLGIPADQRERVFERFVRLDDSRERARGGTGLGLAITRRISREHGGDVVARAGDEGGALMLLTAPTETTARRAPRSPAGLRSVRAGGAPRRLLRANPPAAPRAPRRSRS